jgi:hypothetical protein
MGSLRHTRSLPEDPSSPDGMRIPRFRGDGVCRLVSHPDVKASIKRNSEKMREKAYPHHDRPVKVGAK